MTSALARRVRERTLACTEARRVHRDLMRVADCCLRAELTPPVHRRAERLLLGASETPLRALDALHVAIAIDAAAATFVTYDRQLHRAATAHGLVAAPVCRRDARVGRRRHPAVSCPPSPQLRFDALHLVVKALRPVVRVPALMTVEIRGAPISCSTS